MGQEIYDYFSQALEPKRRNSSRVKIFTDDPDDCREQW